MRPSQDFQVAASDSRVFLQGSGQDSHDISDDSDGPDGRDEGIDLGLDDEPGSLLDFLQTRWEVVKRSGVQLVSGLSQG